MVEAITEMSAQDQGPAPARRKETCMTTAEIIGLITASTALVGGVTAFVMAIRGQRKLNAQIRRDKQ